MCGARETQRTVAGRGARRGVPCLGATDDPNFIEAIARGLDVIRAFDAAPPAMTLSEVAAATDLARPTARRILRTLELLGYVRPPTRATR